MSKAMPSAQKNIKKMVDIILSSESYEEMSSNIFEAFKSSDPADTSEILDKAIMAAELFGRFTSIQETKK